jgi:Fe-S-cluster containining protein
MDEKLLASEEEFELLQKRQPYYQNFFVSGKDELGTLLFTCKHLSWENTCQIYFFRPFMCRNYPKIKRNTLPETFENCGYYFKLDKPFKKFMHNR